MAKIKYEIKTLDDLKANIDENYWQAGNDYLTALEKLGLKPDALFWANDEVVGKMVLVVVTPIYDIAGSLSLAKTLFKAYNLAATPKEISPFILRLHSPDQTIIRDIAFAHEELKSAIQQISTPVEEDIYSIFGKKNYFYTQLNWIYKFDIRKKDSISTLRQWKRFNDNVEKLAQQAA